MRQQGVNSNKTTAPIAMPPFDWSLYLHEMPKTLDVLGILENFQFWAIFENLDNHQVEQKYNFWK